MLAGVATRPCPRLASPSVARLRLKATAAEKISVRNGLLAAASTRLALLVVALACLCSGCVLGPNYTRPAVDVPESYRFDSGDQGVGVLDQPSAWWEGFGDPELSRLVAEALVANHDLRIATARVEEFSARVVAARAQGMPQLGYAAEATRQRIAPVSPGEVHAAYLSAAWELDLWGRIRRENEAAKANLFATKEARVGVALTLVSAVVSGYLTLLDLDRRLEIARETMHGRQQNVELFQMRLDGGAVSDFEMMQVTAEYESAVAAIPDIRLAIAQQEHALSLLVGRNPGPINRARKLQTLSAPPVPGGLPSELIARRPDILQSEQQLIAANALVGAARALYFPSIRLTASGGSVSPEFDSLFSGPSRTWSFAGQLLGPLFAGGALDSANRQAEARHQQALHSYQKTIKNAFREVDDALMAVQAKRELAGSLERRVGALRQALQLARERYDNGYSDYLEVLDTERGLFSAELALTTARGDGYRALVDLYLALGGDWEVVDADSASARGGPGRGNEFAPSPVVQASVRPL